MTRPLVSVITPTANRPEMLERCIRMFLAQDYENKEMTVCASGNTDYNWNRIYGIYPELCLTFLHKSIGAKRNECFRNVSGSIILHMDDDDLYAPDWITKSVAALIES